MVLLIYFVDCGGKSQPITQASVQPDSPLQLTHLELASTVAQPLLLYVSNNFLPHYPRYLSYLLYQAVSHPFLKTVPTLIGLSHPRFPYHRTPSVDPLAQTISFHGIPRQISPFVRASAPRSICSRRSCDILPSFRFSSKQSFPSVVPRLLFASPTKNSRAQSRASRLLVQFVFL